MDLFDVESLHAARCRGLHLGIEGRRRDGLLDLVRRVRSLRMHVTLSFPHQDAVEKAQEMITLALQARLCGAEQVAFSLPGSARDERTVYYEELINQLPAALGKIFETSHWTPEDLFQLWTKWRDVRFPGHKTDGPFVFNTFGDFVKDTMWIRNLENPEFEAPRNKPLIFLGPSLPREKAAADRL